MRFGQCGRCGRRLSELSHRDALRHYDLDGVESSDGVDERARLGQRLADNPVRQSPNSRTLLPRLQAERAARIAGTFRKLSDYF